MKETELIELSDMYLQVRDTKQKIEQQLKDINQELELIELDMIEKMTNNVIDSFKRNGVLFSIVSREFESANPETKEELYRQFKARGYENLFTINANTLGGVIREMKRDNEGMLPEWLNGLINTYEKQSIRIKRD